MAMRPKVCITRWMPVEGIDLLNKSCDVVLAREDRGLSTEEIIELARPADALVCFVSDLIDETVLAGCPRLKVVASFGKGSDNIDVQACTTRGVWVTIIPDLLTDATADMAIGLMLALCRKIVLGDRFVRSGQVPTWHPTRFLGQNMHAKVAGIIGMGCIGRAVARRLRGFNMRVLYHDLRPLPPGVEKEFGVTGCMLPRLLEESDFVVLCLPLNRDSSRRIDCSLLSAMKPSAYLVNVSRGSIVDEAAVAEALAEGRLAGYAADVFAVEDVQEFLPPTSVAEGLLRCPDRTVLTPHLGTATIETRRALSLAVAENVLAALRGDRPPGALNHVVPWIASPVS